MLQAEPVLHMAAVLLAAVLRSRFFMAPQDDALTWLRKALAPAIPAHPALRAIVAILNVDCSSRWDDPSWARGELQRLGQQLTRQVQVTVQNS